MPLARFLYGNVYSTLLTPAAESDVDEVTSCRSPGYRFSPAYNERHCGVCDKTTPASKFGRHLEPPKECRSCGSAAKLERMWDGYRHLLSARTRKMPTGLLPRVEGALREKGWTVEVDGFPAAGLRRCADPAFANGDRLRPHQEEACAAFFSAPMLRGVLRVPTAGGKTAILAAISRAFGGRVLGFVHGKDLLRQVHGDLEMLLGQEVGLLGLGKEALRPITVASIDTVYARLDDPYIREWLRLLDLVWGDEIHRASSMSWTKVLRACGAGARLGVSGTPFKIGELRDLLLEAWTGPLLYDVSISRLQDEGYLARAFLTVVRVRRPTSVNMPDETRVLSRKLGYVDALQYLVYENAERTETVVRMAVERAEAGHKVFLFAGNSLDYAHRLYRAIEERHPGVALATGKAREGENARNLRRFSEGVVDILCVSVVMDEGINVPQADVAILANVGKSHRQTLQRIGRVLRPKADGGSCEVIDFLDETNPHLESHARTRLSYYSEEGIYSDVRLIEDGAEVEIGGESRQAVLL